MQDQPFQHENAIALATSRHSGNTVALCRADLDWLLDHADDDPSVEPADLVFLPSYTGSACGKSVYWWNGEYEGECDLPAGHEGDHYDGLSWFDDNGDPQKGPA